MSRSLVDQMNQAVQANPLCSSVALRFLIGTDHPLGDDALRKIMDIMREAYLLATSRIPMSRIGTFTIEATSNERSRWSFTRHLQPNAGERSIDTVVSSTHFTVLQRRDACNSIDPQPQDNAIHDLPEAMYATGL